MLEGGSFSGRWMLLEVEQIPRQSPPKARSLEVSDTALEQTPSTSETEATAAITLDGVHYPLDQLNEAARGNVASIGFCDDAIQQRHNELAVADTARMTYAAALKRETDATTDATTDTGKALLASLKLLEAQMQKLRNEITLFETARRAYVNALEQALKATGQKD